MKKSCILLIVLLLVLAHGGCAKENNGILEAPEGKTLQSPGTSPDSGEKIPDLDSGPVPLTMMVWGDTALYEEINGILFDTKPELKDKISIQVLIGGGGDADIAKKIRLSVAAGDVLPDMIRLNYTQLPEFAHAGLLENVQRFTKAYKENIMPKALEIMKYNGEILAFPQEVKAKIWYYRKDVFEACGIDVKSVKTLDDFLKVAALVNQKYPHSYIENYGTPSSTYDLMMMLTATGGAFADSKGNYQLTTDPGVRKAFENLYKLNKSTFLLNIPDWTTDWKEAFSNDALVSQLSGSWLKQHLIEWLPEQAGLWNSTVFPEEIGIGSEAGAGIWVIPKNAAHMEQAGEVMATLSYDEEVRRRIFDFNGWIPPLKSVAEDPHYLAQHPFFSESLVPAYLEAMNNLKVYPFNPSSSQEIAIVIQYLDKYLNGLMTLDEALQAAQEDLIKQIGNPYDF